MKIFVNKKITFRLIITFYSFNQNEYKDTKVKILNTQFLQ